MEVVKGNPAAMWQDREVQWAMARFDASKLRMAERSVEIPPPEWREEESSRREAEARQQVECELVDGNGERCGKKFENVAALQAHQRMQTGGSMG